MAPGSKHTWGKSQAYCGEASKRCGETANSAEELEENGRYWSTRTQTGGQWGMMDINSSWQLKREQYYRKPGFVGSGIHNLCVVFVYCGYVPSNPKSLGWGAQKEGRKRYNTTSHPTEILRLQPLLLMHTAFPTFAPLQDAVLYGCEKNKASRAHRWDSHPITSPILL